VTKTFRDSLTLVKQVWRSSMAAAVQLLILGSGCLFGLAALLFAVELVRSVRGQSTRRNMVTLAAFHAGAWLAGWLVWRSLKPTGWTLSFWATVQAGVDSDTYGHVLEHAAEVLAANVIILAAAAGLVAGGFAWISQRRRLEIPHAAAD
jgi:hypothetical protein